MIVRRHLEFTYNILFYSMIYVWSVSFLMTFLSLSLENPPNTGKSNLKQRIEKSLKVRTKNLWLFLFF